MLSPRSDCMFHLKLRLQKLLEFTKRINLCNNLGFVREWSCIVVIVKLKTCIVRLFLLGFTKNSIGLIALASYPDALWARHAIFLRIRGYYRTGTKYYIFCGVGFIIATLTGVFFVVCLLWFQIIPRNIFTQKHLFQGIEPICFYYLSLPLLSSPPKTQTVSDCIFNASCLSGF